MHPDRSKTEGGRGVCQRDFGIGADHHEPDPGAAEKGNPFPDL